MQRMCGVCGSNRKTLIYKQQFVLPTDNYFHSGYNVVMCDNCGFAYADEIPDQDFFEKYYQEMKKKTHLLKRRLTKVEKVDAAAEEDFLYRMHKVSIANIKPYITKNTRIMDVGCHTASLLSRLKKQGYSHLVGLDMSEYAAKIAMETHKIKVHVGSVFDFKSSNKYDFTLLTHVLEHIQDLPRFLKGLSKIMSDEGLLYIEVPDALHFYFPKDNDLSFSSDQKEPFLQFSVEHINYFTKISLHNLMIANGFELVKIEEQVSTITILTSVWRKRVLIKDSWIEESLTQYVRESKTKLGPLYSIIENIAKKQKEIFVWGAGLHTQKLLAQTRLGKCKIAAFIDSDPSYYTGKLIGVKIVPPGEIKSIGKSPILISSYRFQSEIVEQINKMKLANKIITLY